MPAPHAPQLTQQLELLAKEIKKLPTHEIASQLDWPNAEQQKALLIKAAEHVELAKSLLDMYHAGVMRTYNISAGDVT